MSAELCKEQPSLDLSTVEEEGLFPLSVQVPVSPAPFCEDSA